MDLSSLAGSLDPVSLGVGSGLIANAVTAVVGKAARGLATSAKPRVAKPKSRREIRRTTQSDATLVSISRRAAASVAKTLAFKTEIEADRIRALLVSPEVESIVRQIFSAEILKKSGSLNDIKDRFGLIVQLNLRLSATKRGELVDILYSALVEGVRRMLAVEVELGSLAAHDAQESARYNVLRDELASVKKSIVALRLQSRTSLRTIHAFEEKYRDVVGARHSFIVPPHLNEAQKIHIQDLYVSPRFVHDKVKQIGEESTVATEHLLSLTHRTVILGNPGGGKSTFAAKLSYDLATSQPGSEIGGRCLTPILVVLRDYAAENKTKKVSVLQYIEETSNSDCQLKPPASAFEYLLLNGRALVIFDGLDELLETHQRQKVTADVEAFCRLYPSAPVLVTSREVGYEQAPLDESTFQVFRLAAFNDAQVEDYAFKWFAIDAGAKNEQSDRKTKAFLAESKTVPDLRSNPLMLGLICNIYREESYIPRNRPDVYRKCAEMMFDRWDRKREIPVRFRFESEFRPAMAFLAHWIYSTEKLQAGVTEAQLIGKSAAYLLGKRFEDQDEAEAAAKDFVDFCRGRAWVFSNIGSTGAGEELYQFTHRTFLEYFTALYLSRTHETSDALAVALIPKISKREWDVVSQLAFQVKNMESEGGGDRLLHTVLSEAQACSSVERWPLLSFAARCLEFLVPAPSTTRTLAQYCIKQVVDWASAEYQPGHSRGDRDKQIREVIGGLLSAATESRTAVAHGIRDSVDKNLASGSDWERIAVLEIAMHLPIELSPVSDDRPEPFGAREYFSDLGRELCASNSEEIRRLAELDLGLAMDALLHNRLSAEEFVALHGPEAFFNERVYVAYSGVRMIPVAGILLNQAAGIATREPLAEATVVESFRIIGEVAVRSAKPLASRNKLGPFTSWVFNGLEGGSWKGVETWGPSALFGLFCVLAVFAEAVSDRDRAQTLVYNWTTQLPFGFFLRNRGKKDPEIPLGSIEDIWSSEQLSMARQWSAEKVSFLRSPPRGKRKAGPTE